MTSQTPASSAIQTSEVLALLGLSGLAARFVYWAVAPGSPSASPASSSSGLSPAGWAFATFAVTALVAYALRGSYKLFRNSQRRVQVFDGVAPGNKSAMDYLSEARSSLVVTHSSTAVPTQAYIGLMTSKLRGGKFKVTRFLPRGVDKNEPEYTWLKQFEGLPKYEERDVETDPLPFDIFIFDEQRVLLLFPDVVQAQRFSKGIVFDNREIASSFDRALQRIACKP